MKFFKWKTKDNKPVFTKITEKFFGKNIKDKAKKNEHIATVPSVNITDENKAFEVSIALPGFTKEEVNVDIENNCLTISSEKQYSKTENEKSWMRKEYGYASFQRIFALPENADTNAVEAEMKNGILTVRIGKDQRYITHKRTILID